MISYRLGLDIGTNSIGWCALRIDKNGEAVALLDWGSRIFGDGRESSRKEGIPGDSSAVQRREARGMRRRYDRRLMRKKAMLRLLARYGLMPEDKAAQKKLESLNPLQLRAEALTRKLEPYEIGRALFHLQQRRGFKSNRKGANKENEAGAIKEAAARLEVELTAKQTLGQFLYARHKQRLRTRLNPKADGNKILYDYYPTRRMVEEEFDAIWNTQKKYHPELLTEQAREKIGDPKKGAIFFQRPLKPQEVGACLLVPTDKRMPWAMPSAQAFRIIKEVNNLALVSRNAGEPSQKLNAVQRAKLYELLRTNGSMTFTSIRKKLGIDSIHEFNLQAMREKLLGDRTAEIMRRESHFGKRWDGFSIEEQDAIVEKLLDDRLEDEALVAWLMDDYALSAGQAETIVEAALPAAHVRFGKTVITEILPRMLGGMPEHEAIAANPSWHHSRQYTGEILDELPYYGKLLESHVTPMRTTGDPMVKKYGRINNPTVHIALNQIRRLMNTLKGRYGVWPEQIVIEMARELKKGRQEIASIIKEIEKNTKQKEKWRADIESHKGAPATALDFAKYKLWTELAEDPTHRRCVFTGEPINIEMLLSGQVEIEHILPQSLTLDDTSANKTLATRRANRIKGNKTPHDAFKHAPEGIAYESIWERAQILPQSKRWRFRQEAMEIFDSKAEKIVVKSSLDGTSETIDTGLQSFAARQLNDTSYMAKLAKKYLAYACAKGERGVVATPGTLTGLLRDAWGLNALLHPEDADEDTRRKKNRDDHRHHAVDALVIAMTTVSMIQKVQKATSREEEERMKGNDGTSLKRILGTDKPEIVKDWGALKQGVDGIIVSHKPDHGSPAQSGGGTSGRLHEDTYYGYAGTGEKKDTVKIVVRRSLDDFTKTGNLDDIRDPALRDALKAYVYDKEDVAKALKDFSASDIIDGRPNLWKGLQRVRVLDEKPRGVLVDVKKRHDGTAWKLAQGGSNQRADIYCLKSSNKAGQWQMEVIKSFDANRHGFVPKWREQYPDAEHIMTLHGNDMVAYEENGETEVRRVKKMLSNGTVYLTPHTVAKEQADKLSWAASAKQLQLKNARRIFVEIDGSIYDPLGKLTTKRTLSDAAA